MPIVFERLSWVCRVPMGARVGLGAAVMLVSSVAHATPFQYTESFTGSGKIGSTAYSNSAVAITVFADSNDADYDGDGFYENDSSDATVTIGGKTYTLTNVSASAANQQDGKSSLAGVALFGTSIFELGTTNAGFAAYDLTTAIGPLSGSRGSSYVNTGGSFTTTSGTKISFAPAAGSTTFAAGPVASPVPEPASLVLLGTGAAGLATAVRRRFGGSGCAHDLEG